MTARTVKVSDVPLGASEQDLKGLFSSSGDIDYVEMQSGDEWSQIAYVTFEDSQGAENALQLSGAMLGYLSVIVTPAPGYELPLSASAAPVDKSAKSNKCRESALYKAEDILSRMLAKGCILTLDAITKAKAFDKKHQFTSKVVTKAKKMDQKFHVSENTKSAFAGVRSAIKKNKSSNKVVKAGNDVGLKRKGSSGGISG